jgi:nucleoside-diphosphate-sugar epimerase
MTLQEIEHTLITPSAALIEDIKKVEGDVMVLGAGGKMGPDLSKMLKNAVDAAGVLKKVIAVSRFSNPAHKEELESFGIEVIACDLMNEQDLRNLPEVGHIVYMIGHKFGTQGNQPATWAINAYLPGRVAETFRRSTIVAFSTGNVYPFYPVHSKGPTEKDTPGPVGEYAQSCLGRERILEFFSKKYAIPMAVIRLNYAVEVKYGVLLDIAQAVKEERPIDLRMGYVNIIWQGDAIDMALRALRHGACPPHLVNVTGPEPIAVRTIAMKFAERFGKKPFFQHKEEDTALLSDAGHACQLFGAPSTSLDTMIDYVAQWISEGGDTLDKPTHFQERKGKF